MRIIDCCACGGNGRRARGACKDGRIGRGESALQVRSQQSSGSVPTTAITRARTRRHTYILSLEPGHQVKRRQRLGLVYLKVAHFHWVPRPERRVDRQVAHDVAVEHRRAQRRLVRPRAARHDPHLVRAAGVDDLARHLQVPVRDGVERTAQHGHARSLLHWGHVELRLLSCQSVRGNTHTRTHARTHARTHTHAHTHLLRTHERADPHGHDQSNATRKPLRRSATLQCATQSCFKNGAIGWGWGVYAPRAERDT